MGQKYKRNMWLLVRLIGNKFTLEHRNNSKCKQTECNHKLQKFRDLFTEFARSGKYCTMSYLIEYIFSVQIPESFTAISDTLSAWKRAESIHLLKYTIPVDEARFPNIDVSYHNHFGYFQPVRNIQKHLMLLVVISILSLQQFWCRSLNCKWLMHLQLQFTWMPQCCRRIGVLNSKKEKGQKLWSRICLFLTLHIIYMGQKDLIRNAVEERLYTWQFALKTI